MYNDKKEVKSRDEQLQENWESLMPCENCSIKDVCKYRTVIKRVDYPSEVFKISISCNLKSKYETSKPAFRANFAEEVQL